MDVLAVAGKGGTGKTTTVASVSHELANGGARVLAVDLDGQASLSDWLTPRQHRRPMVEDALLGRAAWADVVVEVSPAGGGLLVAPTAPYALLEVERHIEALPRRREHFIGAALAEADLAALGIDIVVLDTPRSMGSMLTVNVLEAADRVVLPCDANGMGLNALVEAVRAVQALGEERGVDLLAGVLPTKIRKTTLAGTVVENFSERGWPVLPGVRATVKAEECVSFHQLLGDYAPTCTAAEDYAMVATELIKMGVGFRG